MGVLGLDYLKSVTTIRAPSILVTLKAAGILESNSRGQYRLGMRLFELGSQAPVMCRLLEESRGLLERLASDIGRP